MNEVRSEAAGVIAELGQWLLISLGIGCGAVVVSLGLCRLLGWWP